VISPVRALLIEREDFLKLLEDGKLAREVVRGLCRAVRERDRRIGYLLSEGALERIAGVLLYLSQRHNAREDQDTPVLQVTHAQLAAFIGSAPETVCKELKRLQGRQILIQKGRGKVTLRREELLSCFNP
jgi:CRP-like cAMP-binding protein